MNVLFTGARFLLGYVSYLARSFLYSSPLFGHSMYLLFRRYLKFGHILSDLLILLLGNAQRVLN